MRIFSNITVPAVLLTGALALSGCGVKTAAPEINPDAQTGGGIASGGSGLSFVMGKSSGGSAQAAQIQVNAYLWRASLSTLSFMPLVSADPFGGVIITDWYTPPATPDERFKVNAYILGKQLTANNVEVSVFHQIQQGGQWVDAPADAAVASGLEDRILAQAADMQAAAQNTK